MMLIGYNLCILLNFSSKSGVKLDNGTYLCKGCNRTTKRLRPMQQHLLSHSASKFNLCVKCLKGFNDKYDMKRHTRKHTRKFNFQYCIIYIIYPITDWSFFSRSKSQHINVSKSKPTKFKFN